jgi:hypothetical protein
MKTLDLEADPRPDPNRPKMVDPGSALTNADPPTLQCCQLLGKISGQFGGKIRPLRKESGPSLIFTFLKAFWFK